MTQFKNILLACGWEDNKNIPLARLVSLVQETGAQITAVCVVDTPPADKRKLSRTISEENLQQLVIKDSQSHLDEFVKPFEQAGMHIDRNILLGKPFIAIIQKVLRDHHDLVIIPAHEGQNTAERKLLHTTTIKLLRQCPCPVWVMRAKGAGQYQRILAAVDPDPHDYENEQINMKILDIASSMAHLENSKLHIVHAWNLYGERIFRMSHGHSSSEFNTILEEVKKAHEESLSFLLNECGIKDSKIQIHLLKGDAGDLIPSLVERENIDLVVMGTHSRSGAAGFLMGNTSEKIMHHVNCSVITVKPDMFVAVVA